MKNASKHILIALLASITLSASAQQVNTLYFLENAPMRHTINPAFQPVSRGYINFSPLGWTSLSVGNNTFTVSDLVFVDPATGQTITILHPNATTQRTQLMRALPSMALMGVDANVGILNMGFRIKEDGFLTIGINGRVEMNGTMPRQMVKSMLSTIDFTSLNFNLAGMGMGAKAFFEIGAGYSHRINEQWTVGGKARLLLGYGYGGFDGNQLNVNTSAEAWRLHGNLDLNLAGPINFQYLGSKLNGQSIQDLINSFSGGGAFSPDSLINTKNVAALATPSGYGASFDIGFTYKPIEQLQISAAITDLGFIYWTKAAKLSCTVDTTFTGLGNIDYSDPAYQDANGNFSFQKVTDKAVQDLESLLKAFKMNSVTNIGMANMLTARLNVGLDANFWDNRVGLGVLSATRLYNARLYEEVTFGLAFRPVNWFNIAASYSLLNNGKYSNIGAGIGFMPYDGINMTIAMDYIPTSYAALPNKDAAAPKQYFLPDRAKMVNIALGFSICWGSNRRDKDKDGVWDKIDMCPNTPRGVQVDSVGCPIDSDHDGVPDYLDHCPGTPEAAIGFVDSVGCPKDSDGDGVPDYLDQCPNTPEAAIGFVDSVGCPKDSDGDGVPDYMDECPNTPAEARGMVDERGCPKDSDGDGVPDYLDECPNTPAEARGMVDEKGCPKDSDGDGVPDYLDECPDTPKEVNGKVDAKGCILDSDGDGVPDYIDECPYQIGPKENKGCPEVKREVRQLLKKAMQGIEFETGKATIKSKSFPLLDLIATIFIENSNYIIEVQGHTDNTGKAEVNQKLSQSRAEAVMNYLIKKGVPAERLSAVGYGPDVPIADNKTKAGRAKNRRVEFKITFEEVHYEMYMDRADSPAPAAE